MALVPLHPEAVPGEAGALRWVVPAGLLDLVGEPAAVPAVLADLCGPVLAQVVVEPGGVVTRLAAGRSWAADGAAVRSALQQALADPEGWVAPAGSDADAVLRAAVEQVLAGDVGDYVRSHGGRIDVLEVHDGQVEVSLAGACEHCPAAEITLTRRFEDALQAAVPTADAVVRRQDAPPSGRRLLPLLTRRPGA